MCFVGESATWQLGVIEVCDLIYEVLGVLEDKASSAYKKRHAQSIGINQVQFASTISVSRLRIFHPFSLSPCFHDMVLELEVSLSPLQLEES